MNEIVSIALVADQDLVREGVKSLLALSGRVKVVLEARDGDGLLVGIDAASPEVVVMDIRMPVMDGLESARRIRTSGRPDARRIPIIALTANAFDEDTRKSLASGMNGHLSKPIQVDQMLETLGKCMGLKK